MLQHHGFSRRFQKLHRAFKETVAPHDERVPCLNAQLQAVLVSFLPGSKTNSDALPGIPDRALWGGGQR